MTPPRSSPSLAISVCARTIARSVSLSGTTLLKAVCKGLSEDKLFGDILRDKYSMTDLRMDQACGSCGRRILDPTGNHAVKRGHRRRNECGPGFPDVIFSKALQARRG